MDDFPTKIADFLEDTATRIRSITVDRPRGVAKWAALGLVLAVLGLLIVIFLFVGLFRIVGELIGVRSAWAAFGGLFVLIGALLWSKRNSPAEKANEDDD
jgi:hypothetical protein